jgi:hypothetical protein
MNHFARNKWHQEKELHKLLGIDKYEIKQVDKDVAIYCDTDSTFVWFEPILESIQGMPEMSKDDTIKFLLEIDRLGIKPYLEKAFTKYAERFNTVNQQDFELENISSEGIWLAKKNYILNVAYVDNEKRDLLPVEKRYQVIKGLETVKGSFPKWAREKLSKLYDVLLQKGKEVDVDRDLIPMMIEYKAEFMEKSMDDIAFNFNLNDLDKYLIDLDQLAFQKGIPQIPRGSAYHNYLVRKTKSERVREITPGQKVKLYHCAPNEHEFDIFCYVPTEFPEEFAPPMDRDEQFWRLIVNPINRFLEAYKIIPLNNKLQRIVEVIKTRTKKPIPDEKFYPLYVIDKVNLVYTEIPEKFWKIIGNPNEFVAPEDFGEYLSIISKYDLNTAIVSNFELEKFIARTKKSQAKKDAKKLSEFEDNSNAEE